MPLVSWQQYDEEHHLSEVLTDAARACVAAGVQCPREYLATYFVATTRGDAVDALTCSPVLTLHGAGYVVRLRLCTMAESEARAVSEVCVCRRQRRRSTDATKHTTHTHNGGNSRDEEDEDDGDVEDEDGGGGGVGDGDDDDDSYDRRDVAAVQRACAAVCAHVHQHVVPALLRVGVSGQRRWDSALTRVLHSPVGVTEAGVRRQLRPPSSLRFAFSLAAARAVARTRRVPLHEHCRSLYTRTDEGDGGDVEAAATAAATARHVAPSTTAAAAAVVVATAEGATGADAARTTYKPPQVLLPFFGRALTTSACAPHGSSGSGSGSGTTTTAAAASSSSSSSPSAGASAGGVAQTAGGDGGGGAAAYATPPGTVCIHTVYLIPSAEAAATPTPTTTTTTAAATTTTTTTGSGSGAHAPAVSRGKPRTSTTTTTAAAAAAAAAASTHKSSVASTTAGAADGGAHADKATRDGRRVGANRHDAADGSRTCVRGGLSADMLSRLLTAYRVFAARHGECAVRDDGAFVYDALENIRDAVAVCAEVLREAGLVLGVDVFLGVRIDCPVATYTAAVAATAATTTTAEQATGAGGKAGGNSGGGGGGGGRAGKAAGKTARTASAATTPPPSLQQQQQQQQQRGGGGGGGGGASTTLYTLFPGDPDITAAQLTEYVKQQVAACEGALVLVENTHATHERRGARGVDDERTVSDSGNSSHNHTDNTKDKDKGDGDDGDKDDDDDDDDDVAGVHRLQRAVGDRVVVSRRVQAACGCATTEAMVRRVERGLRHAWAMSYTVDPVDMGSVSACIDVCRRIEASGCGVGVACARAAAGGDDACALVELALGLNARYLDVGGLNSPMACVALSHYVTVLEQLPQVHTLAPQCALTAVCARLQRRAGDDEDGAAVPEIRRRGDKKRKKPNK